MRALCLSLLAASLPLSALAAPVTTSRAKAVLSDYGVDVTDDWTVNQTSRVLDFQLGDLRATLRLGDCDTSGNCSYAMMFATFELNQSADQTTYEKTNHYNDSHPFGRAFVLSRDDEDDAVGIDYSVDLSGNADFSTDDVRMFMAVIDAYIKHWTES